MAQWTKEKVEERINFKAEQSSGAALRLAEMLRRDPDADVSAQLEMLREICRAYKEADRALDTFPLELEPAPIEWQPAHF